MPPASSAAPRAAAACVVLLALLPSACEPPRGGEASPGAPADSSAPPPAVARLIRPDADRYAARRAAGDSVQIVADIPYETTNTRADTLYLIGCNTPPAPVLERRTADGWQVAFSPLENACLSPPWVIPPGASRRDTLRVGGYAPGQNRAPAFAPPVEGVYRLNRAMYTRTGPEAAFPQDYRLLPPEERVSDPFTIE